MRAGARWSLRLLSLIIVGASTLPIVGALREEHRARRQFPVLADFGRAEELERFEWRDSTPGPPDAGADGGVRVALRPARYPGFALTYFPRDWRGYRQFVFTATNPSAAPLPLVIRIDDERHNQDYTDRFNAGYVLAPGRNEIRVPLAAVETAPRGRKLDLARVRQVVIFSHGLGERRDVIVESLRLEK